MKRIKNIFVLFLGCVTCITVAVGIGAAVYMGRHRHGYEKEVTPPTCTERGYTTYTCECGDSYTADYVGARGHNYIDGKCGICGSEHAHSYEEAVTEPTCKERGFTTFTCSCGVEFTDDYTDPIAHKYSGGKCTMCGEEHDHDFVPKVTEPTCTKKGYTQFNCEGCGYGYTDNFTDTLEHDYKDGKCTQCGSLKATEGLLYEISDDGTYYSCVGLKENGGEVTDLVIPSSYNGKPVKTIGNGAFTDNKNLQTVYIYDSVISIGERAFSGCEKLESITVPDTVTFIGNYAFENCASLTEAIIPLGVDSIGMYVFANCVGLTEVVIPDRIKSVGEYAFYCCENLKSITISDSVKEVAESAFLGCDKVVTATLPSAFITSVSNNRLTTVVITTGKEIPANAFYKSYNLKSVTLPDSIASIGDRAFAECWHLTEINFDGTIAEWGAIATGTDWDANCGEYTVVCTDGDTHKHAYRITTVAPTCSSKGYTKGVCERCGYEYVFKYTAQLSHVYEMTEIEPTCTEKGRTVGVCVNCGYDYIFKYTSQLGHNYVNHICTRCNEQEATKALKYVLSEDGNSYICTGIGTTTNISEIIIPSEFNGKPVTAIGERAFKDYKNFISVLIPDSVTEIRNYAFGNTRLVSVVIPDSVTVVGNYAFYGCSNLVNITIPAGVTALESYTFASCTSLKTINFKGTVEEWRAIPHTDWLKLTCTVQCTNGTA